MLVSWYLWLICLVNDMICNRISIDYWNDTYFKILIISNINLRNNMLSLIRSREYCLLLCSWTVADFFEIITSTFNVYLSTYYEYSRKFLSFFIGLYWNIIQRNRFDDTACNSFPNRVQHIRAIKVKFWEMANLKDVRGLFYVSPSTIKYLKYI